MPRPAAIARLRARLGRTLGGPTAVALAGVASLGAGITVQFGHGWALITVGALAILGAVRMASTRRR